MIVMTMIESSKSAKSYLNPNQHCCARHKTTSSAINYSTNTTWTIHLYTLEYIEWKLKTYIRVQRFTANYSGLLFWRGWICTVFSICQLAKDKQRPHSTVKKSPVFLTCKRQKQKEAAHIVNILHITLQNLKQKVEVKVCITNGQTNGGGS